MKKLDWYILKKFLLTFFFCLLLMTIIVLVIDWSEHAEDFVKSRLPFSRIVSDYYLGFIPRIVAMLFPLFVFICVVFFTSKMAERMEIIAILSSGVSFRRFLLPYWVGSIFLSFILWTTYHKVLPDANRIWSQFESKYVGGSLDYSTSPFPRNFYFRIDSNTCAGMRYFDTVSKSGGVFFIQKFEKNKLVYNMRAENFLYDTMKNVWKFNHVLERKMVGDTEFISLTPELSRKFKFKPVDLRKDEFLKDRLTTPQLDELIEIEEIRAKERVNSLLAERYNRDAIPISVIVLSMIGAIIASKKVRGGSGFHMAVGILLSVLYVLFSRFSIVFSSKGNFPPLLAAWTPNLIFIMLAFYLYRKAPK